LTPPDPQLKGAWYPGGFNPCAYQVKNRFQSLLSICNLRRYATLFFDDCNWGDHCGAVANGCREEASGLGQGHYTRALYKPLLSCFISCHH
jgi:hypothetical protein